MNNSKLFEKYLLNNHVSVSNRLVIAPITLFASNVDGSISEEERQYFQNRANGIGIYILGSTAISPEGISSIYQPRAFSDKDLPSLSERANIIKKQGSLAILQLNHRGAFARQDLGLSPVAPSAEIAKKIVEEKGMPLIDMHELTDNEIIKIINKFAYATELAIKAGYDGIELHGANNYLIQQFFSPYTNRRNDDWGGSNNKRMNFPIQIVDAVCKVRDKYNRPDFIIGYRLSPEEPYEEGITMTDTLRLVRALSAKPIQYIHISQANFFQKVRRGDGEGQERLKVIHNETKGKVALIGVGGLLSENDFNLAMKSGFCEFIAVGRASMINTNLGSLLAEGKGDKINLTLDPQQPEKYSIPSTLWKMCISGQEWLPPLKDKTHK